MDIPLVADLFWSQILADWARGSGADLFIVGSRFLTQMGTPACFAAAGSARIEGAEITEDGFGSCTVATFAGGIFFERQSAGIRPLR